MKSNGADYSQCATGSGGGCMPPLPVLAARRALRVCTGSQQQAARGTQHPHGLTLIEVMITMAIFVVLAGFTIMAVREVVTSWSVGERRRVVFEKAAGCVDVMADDIRLALTQEPPGATDIKAKFIGDYDPATRQQRLMFVRSFESGPERAITFTAGDGIDNNSMLKPQSSDGTSVSPPVSSTKSDSEDFTGLKVGDFRALGGMAMVGYFVQNQNLYRVIHAPVPDSMSSQLKPGNAQILATDVLYLGFEYWSQVTDQWDEPPARSKLNGPEKMWDSTRAISVGALRNFRFHRGTDSAFDTEDDIFPQKVRITLTVDSTMPRCVYTKITDEMGPTEIGKLNVDSTKGFADGGDESSYLLIENEWLHYKSKTSEYFVIDRRGARGTNSTGHKADSVVRTGRSFRRVIYLPNYREDPTIAGPTAAQITASDQEWRARRDAQLGSNKKKRTAP